MLGYDTTDPFVVVPEYTADRDTKKGEKVDYALKNKNETIILIECKWSGDALTQEHRSQLSRYFDCDDARFAILTNGIQYQFFTDLDKANKMDKKPFFVFDLQEFQEHDVQELKKFSKSAFSLDEILNTANELKYTGEIKKILETELFDPSEQFVRFFSSQVYSGRLSNQKLAGFTAIVKKAREQFIDEIIKKRLNRVSEMSINEQSVDTGNVVKDEIETNSSVNVAMTGKHVESYLTIKSILCEVVDIKRISIRKAKNYYLIMLDNTNRKPICRLYCNLSSQHIGIISNKKVINKVSIISSDDIYTHKKELKEVISEYDGDLVAERKTA